MTTHVLIALSLLFLSNVEPVVVPPKTEMVCEAPVNGTMRCVLGKAFYECKVDPNSDEVTCELVQP